MIPHQSVSCLWPLHCVKRPGSLAFTTGPGQKPRERGFAARHQARVLQEVAQATKRCGLPETAVW
jgi:hypothetical protein